MVRVSSIGISCHGHNSPNKLLSASVGWTATRLCHRSSSVTVKGYLYRVHFHRICSYSNWETPQCTQITANPPRLSHCNVVLRIKIFVTVQIFCRRLVQASVCNDVSLGWKVEAFCMIPLDQ